MTLKNKSWLWAILFAGALLLICFLLPGCKSVEKANEQAYQRVLTDSTMFKRLYNAGRRVYEVTCINDTILGETEIMVLSDTTVLPGRTDTIVRPDTIRITVTKTDRVTQYIIDNRAVNELQDSLHAAQLSIAAHSGQLLEKDNLIAAEQTKVKEAEKKAKNKDWLIWGLVVALVGSWAIRIPGVKTLLKL